MAFTKVTYCTFVSVAVLILGEICYSFQTERPFCFMMYLGKMNNIMKFLIQIGQVWSENVIKRKVLLT